LESISIIDTLSNPILESKIQRTIEGLGSWFLKLVVKDKTYDPEGLILSDFQSFDTDNIPDHVGKYASPYVTFRVEKIDNGKKTFILISIQEFDEFPIICKKACYVDDKPELQVGDICTRTRNTKPQSSKVTSFLDMKGIIDLAIEKGVTLFVERTDRTGLSPNVNYDQNDEIKFMEQLRDFS
jgi:hypothetical protein